MFVDSPFEEDGSGILYLPSSSSKVIDGMESQGPAASAFRKEEFFLRTVLQKEGDQVYFAVYRDVKSDIFGFPICGKAAYFSDQQEFPAKF